MVISLPTIQAIRYAAGAGEHEAYGIRLSSPQHKGKGRAGEEQGGGQRRDWAIEIGKISDDSLKSNLAGGYVGLYDSWYYFQLRSEADTHTLLASMFLTDLITRAEAESVLARGPHSSPSPSASTSSAAHPSYLNSTIHRLPSLATLGGAYWAGSSAMTELVASSSLLSAASGMTVAALPVATGALAVGGALLLFSRSARAGLAVEREAGELVRARREAEEMQELGTEMVLYERQAARVRRLVDVSKIHVLTRDELDDNPLYSLPPDGYTIEDLARRWRIEGPPAPNSDPSEVDQDGYVKQL